METNRNRKTYKTKVKRKLKTEYVNEHLKMDIKY